MTNGVKYLFFSDFDNSNVMDDKPFLEVNMIAQVPRLLALQDRDPDTPMRGCMHPAYWRDKSSDVADLRRQEAALTFAWPRRLSAEINAGALNERGSLMRKATKALSPSSG